MSISPTGTLGENWCNASSHANSFSLLKTKYQKSISPIISKIFRSELKKYLTIKEAKEMLKALENYKNKNA